MKLKQLQSTFAASLFYLHDDITKTIKETEQITPEQRLQVYRNSFIMGVSEALAITYQHTLALVGEEFFNSVSRAFILATPPSENNIITYGEGFNEYLAGLAQLNEMPYISEMARFEWLLEQTSNKKVDDKQLDLSQLALLPEDELDRLTFQTPTQISLFHSTQNISHLYNMLITDDITESDLNTACYLVLKKHPDFRVELIPLQETQFQLLTQIIDGRALGEIIPEDLHQQLPSLLTLHLLNGFTLTKEIP